MSFLDRAKAAANELAAKADAALGSAGLGGAVASGGGEAERYFRDLGVVAYLEAVGRPGDPAERARVVTALREFEARGAIRSLALQTAAPPPPFASQPPPAAGSASSPASQAPPSQSSPPPPPPSSTPPPPPPSWLSTDGGV